MLWGCTWFGRTKARICPTTWTDSKWRPVPLKREGFFYSKPDRNVPLWIQNWKGNMPQNTRLQTNGRQSPKSDSDMSNSSVKTLSIRKYCKNVRFTHDHERFRNVRCFECKSRTVGPLETFGSKVVGGWRFRFGIWTSLDYDESIGHRKSAVC